MKSDLTLIMLILSVFIYSCKNKPAEVAEPETGLIEISKAQFESEKMEFGEAAITPFSVLVHFTGSVVPSVNGQAQISLPARGLIVRINCKPGQEISKGAVMFEVSGNEFIDMQKDYAESVARLKQLKNEYERQKELNNDNIVAKKDFIMAESAYNMEMAKCSALKLKIQLLGLDAAKIEGGQFYDLFKVKAPIKGYITNINANIGQYIESQQIIAEVVDPATFQARLSVFERDISKVNSGQNVDFYLAGNKDLKFNAKITSVGKAIDNVTKSISCFAAIENLSGSAFVNNQFIEGDIIVESDSAYSVPWNAILKSGNDSYILYQEKVEGDTYYLGKQKVNIGRRNGDFIELPVKPGSDKILIKGVYNIKIE